MASLTPEAVCESKKEKEKKKKEEPTWRQPDPRMAVEYASYPARCGGRQWGGVRVGGLLVWRNEIFLKVADTSFVLLLRTMPSAEFPVAIMATTNTKFQRMFRSRSGRKVRVTT